MQGTVACTTSDTTDRSKVPYSLPWSEHMAIADRVTNDFQKNAPHAHNMYTDHTGRGASVKTRPGRVYWFVWPNVH